MTRRDEELDFVDQNDSSFAPKLAVWLVIGFVVCAVVWDGMAELFSGFDWGSVKWAMPEAIADSLPSGRDHRAEPGLPGCTRLENGVEICEEDVVRKEGG